MEEDRARTFVCFLDEFARLRGRIQSAFDQTQEGARLTDVENVVLNAVTGAASPPTVPQIGRSLGHARQVIQRAAHTLVERGLIETIPNPDHKRAHRLVPTAAGLAVKAEADRRGLIRAAALTEGLDDARISEVVSSLREIRECLEQNMRRDSAGQ